MTPGVAHFLRRETFTTSRALDFCSERELTKQIGHASTQWPLVILKELVDNALDAAEESDIAPVIHVAVQETINSPQIIITDNGPGIPVSTIEGVLDFTSRTSSREAYVSPTRGAQGNALKTIVAMAFALDTTKGETMIESCGVAHRIVFGIDPVRQQPKVTHTCERSDVTTGTRVTVCWPVCARSKLAEAKSTFLQMAANYGWLNPHLSLKLLWDNVLEVDFASTDPAWNKWKPSQPTSPHWYDVPRLRRLMSAYICADQDRKRESRTVREFVSEFRGLAGSAKQKAVLDEAGASRLSLEDYLKTANIGPLLAAMKRQSKPVEPKHLGLIGEQHLAARFNEAGSAPEAFKYKKALGDGEGLPFVAETAFGYCPNGTDERRIIVGANWSVAIGNPFRSLGGAGESLDTILANQRATRDEPIVLILHLARPRLEFTDHGKTAIALEGDHDE